MVYDAVLRLTQCVHRVWKIAIGAVKNDARFESLINDKILETNPKFWSFYGRFFLCVGWLQLILVVQENLWEKWTPEILKLFNFNFFSLLCFRASKVLDNFVVVYYLKTIWGRFLPVDELFFCSKFARFWSLIFFSGAEFRNFFKFFDLPWTFSSIYFLPNSLNL